MLCVTYLHLNCSMLRVETVYRAAPLLPFLVTVAAQRHDLKGLFGPLALGDVEPPGITEAVRNRPSITDNLSCVIPLPPTKQRRGSSFKQMVGSWSCPVTEHSLSTLDIKTSQPTQRCGPAGKEKCPWAKMAYGLKGSTTRLSNCHSNSKLCFTRQFVMRHSPTTHQAAKGFFF